MKHKTLFMFLLLFSMLLVAKVSVQAYYPHTAKPTDDGEDGGDTSTGDNGDTSTDGNDTEHDGGDDGGDSNHDGIDDNTEHASERQVEVEQSGNEWQIHSELKNGESKDKIELTFKIGDGKPVIKLEYKSESSSSESEMKYRINFDQIVEFNDTGSAAGYDANDTVVSSYKLSDASWNDITYTTQTINGAEVYIATAGTADGVFTLVLKISTGIVNSTEGIMTPNAIKIDVELSNYAYQANNTYLALKTDIKTGSETKKENTSEDEMVGFAHNETQVGIDNAQASAFFSWINTASADNSTVDVLSSNVMAVNSAEKDDDVSDGETQQALYFTFDAQNPKQIVWDPKVGVVSQGAAAYLSDILLGGNASNSGLNLPGFTFFLAFFAITGVASVYRIRRTKKRY